MFLIAACTGLLNDPSITGRSFDLSLVTPAEAWGYQGRLVRSTFTLTCPPCTLDDVTAVGTGLDDIMRTAILPKDLSLGKGDEVTVVGVLEVLGHPAMFVGPVFVPGWTEIRLAPARLLSVRRPD